MLRIKEGFDNRANNLVILSATVTTLLFGFGASLYGEIKPEYAYLNWVGITLFIGIIFSITSIFFGVFANTRKLYAFPFGEDIFLNPDGTKKTKEIDDNAGGKKEITLIDKYRNLTENALFGVLIDSYLKALGINTKLNSLKGTLITISQVCLLIGVITAPVLLGLLLTAISLGMVKSGFGLPI